MTWAILSKAGHGRVFDVMGRVDVASSVVESDTSVIDLSYARPLRSTSTRKVRRLALSRLSD